MTKPCFIIAEAGVNHNGSLESAFELAAAANEAGADAVKFQTFVASELATPEAPKASYQSRHTGSGESQLEMLARLELSFADFTRIKQHCDRLGILFLSTAFDTPSLKFLADLGVPSFKIPSGEVTNLPYLQQIGRYRRPVLLSTGMCNLGEVEQAIEVLYREGTTDIVLLHCVSNYPAAPEEANLRAMQTLAGAFGLPVGYSDHTLGSEVCLAAVALGATVIEKHFTLDCNLPGPDHKASLEPAELASLVRAVRKVEASLGSGRKRPTASEADTAAVARKSLVCATDLPAGTVIIPEMIAVRRPGTGLPPSMYSFVLGRTLRHALRSGQLITLDSLG